MADVTEVALTIDDLPQGGCEFGLDRMQGMTDRLVGGLGSHRIPAVGFVNEAQLYVAGEVDRRIALLEAWASAGNELGNHTFAHRRFRDVGRAAMQDDVIRGETVTRILAERHHLPVRYFRHPYLDTGPDLETRAAFEAFLADRGYVIAPVTIDLDDWMYALVYGDAKTHGDEARMAHIADEYLGYVDATVGYAEACADALFGRPIRHVLLIHANELNADHVDALVGVFERRATTFVTLAQALEDPAYQSPNTFGSDAGVPWLDRWAATRGASFEVQRPDPSPWVRDSYRRLDAVAPERIPGSRN